MAKLQSFFVFLNKRLTEAALDIFVTVERTVLEYQEENDRIRNILQQTPEIRLCKTDSLPFSLSFSEEEVPSDEEVPSEQQHRELQENPETTPIKEEPEELLISQEGEPTQGPFETKDSIFTPPGVKSECDQGDPLHKAMLTEYPTLSWSKVSQLKTFHVFLKDFFTVSAAVKIFGAVEKTVAEYQEENDRLRRILLLTPEMKLCRTEEEVPPKQQHCEKEWGPLPGQEVPEPTQIKEEQEELGTNHKEEQDRGAEPDIIEFIIPPSCVKSERDQQDPLNSLPQAQAMEREFKPGDLKPSPNVTHLEVLDISCNPPDYFNKKFLKQNKGTRKEKSFSCDDCGKSFSQKGALNRHIVIHTGEKPFCCGDCGKCFSRKGSLGKHILTHTGDKPFSCSDCGKCFSRKEHLTLHIRTHTGEKPFSCGDCGKNFYHRQTLKQHELTHTGKKSFSCGDCGKSFNNRQTLNQHKLTHTGEKSFSCDDCGKCFSQKGTLKSHILTHTGEKPFICENCGKSFSQKHHLERHMLTHTGEKAFSCGGCKKCFSRKEHLVLHMRTHTGEKSFSYGDYGKTS